MKKIAKFFVILTAISIPISVFALEVGFPTVGGYTPGESTMGPAEWIRYIYLLSFAVVGIALIYTFSRAGIEWMLGGTNPGMINSARKRIWDGLFGLLILLGSYVFLREINPNLVSIKNPEIRSETSEGGILDILNSIVREESIFEKTVEEDLNNTCTPSSECGNPGLTCQSGKCVPINTTGKCASNQTCRYKYTQYCMCPTGQSCFPENSESGSGAELSNVVPGYGVCDNRKHLGETCDPNASPSECYGSNSECKISTGSTGAETYTCQPK